MTITIPGCAILELDDQEKEHAAFIGECLAGLYEMTSDLPKGALKVEFAKAVATDRERAGYFVKYTDGNPFYAVEVKAGETRISEETLRMSLVRLAFKGGVGSVQDTPPVLFCNFRGTMANEGVSHLIKMVLGK